MQALEFCAVPARRIIAKIEVEAKRFVAGEAVAAMIENRPARLAPQAFRDGDQTEEIDPDRMSKSSSEPRISPTVRCAKRYGDGTMPGGGPGLRPPHRQGSGATPSGAITASDTAQHARNGDVGRATPSPRAFAVGSGWFVLDRG